MTKLRKIKAKVIDISPQRQQYRPYLYTLEPVNLYVELPLDDDIVLQDGEEVVITLDGFTALLGKIATSLDDIHKQYEYKSV